MFKISKCFVCLVCFLSCFIKQLKRNVGAATRANYVTALNYATKFCHADKSPKYDSVPLVQKLRQLATNLGREGQQQRWDAKEDKEDEGKWLDWYVVDLPSNDLPFSLHLLGVGLLYLT